MKLRSFLLREDASSAPPHARSFFLHPASSMGPSCFIINELRFASHRDLEILLERSKDTYKKQRGNFLEQTAANILGLLCTAQRLASRNGTCLALSPVLLSRFFFVVVQAKDVSIRFDFSDQTMPLDAHGSDPSLAKRSRLHENMASQQGTDSSSIRIPTKYHSLLWVVPITPRCTYTLQDQYRVATCAKNHRVLCIGTCTIWGRSPK